MKVIFFFILMVLWNAEVLFSNEGLGSMTQNNPGSNIFVEMIPIDTRFLYERPSRKWINDHQFEIIPINDHELMLPIDAGTLVPNSYLFVNMNGTVTLDRRSVLRFRYRWFIERNWIITLATSEPSSPLVNLQNVPWAFRGMVHLVTTDINGTVATSGTLEVGSSIKIELPFVEQHSINTNSTIMHKFGVEMAFSNSHASNSFTVKYAKVHYIKEFLLTPFSEKEYQVDILGLDE